MVCGKCGRRSRRQQATTTERQAADGPTRWWREKNAESVETQKGVHEEEDMNRRGDEGAAARDERDAGMMGAGKRG